eukprot:gnl/Dysnectes_brevis/11162_a23154_136.p1 GENE.gnl/Dysnectes_brevis/11162_a23154_136~~gnl/Dysnectes_brevis/11162_a23154_136.p1  ORF type:complete len:156 (+),score=18.86 gnl/Dysnectes_brevis/11162_a23154_136:82-549(+)
MFTSLLDSGEVIGYGLATKTQLIETSPSWAEIDSKSVHSFIIDFSSTMNLYGVDSDDWCPPAVEMPWNIAKLYEKVVPGVSRLRKIHLSPVRSSTTSSFTVGPRRSIAVLGYVLPASMGTLVVAVSSPRDPVLLRVKGAVHEASRRLVMHASAPL